RPRTPGPSPDIIPWIWSSPIPAATFFFFQAEDGIRAGHVTGVQTCALPISDHPALVQERGDDEVADPALDDLLVDVGLVPERGEVLDDERAPLVHRALVDGPLELLLRVVPRVGEDARVLALGAVVQDEHLVAAQRGEA